MQNPDVLIYNTYGICGVCAVLEKRGLRWKDASVVRRGERVYLKTQCKDHGMQETVYCSSVTFFDKVMSYALVKPPQTSDIEDLRQRMNYSATSLNTPLLMELDIFKNNAFLSNDQIRDEALRFKKLYPPGNKFLLKVCGRLATDMKTLNAKAQLVAGLLPAQYILLEMSYERLHLIGRLANSVLYKGNVYPSVKYLVRQGDEAQCEQELAFLLSSLRDFTDIHLVVSLLIERPFPKLNSILQFLRSQSGFVRFVVLSLQRPPTELVKTMEERVGSSGGNANAGEEQDRLRRIGADLDARSGTRNGSSSDTSTPSASLNTVDPHELLMCIEEATQGSIRVDDFLPLSVAMLLEPLLSALGYGNFRLRASPFCGFACALVNTEAHKSVPMTRMYDVGALWRELSPLIAKESGFSVFTAAKVVKSAERMPNMPDLLSYLSDKEKQEVRSNTLKAMQFVVVHNNMDLGAVDMLRRCDCMHATATIVTPSGLAASCTGCI